MKKFIVSITLTLLALTALPVFSQEIPKGNWAGEPGSLDDKTPPQRLQIRWKDGCMFAEFNEDGGVTNITFSNEWIGKQDKHYAWPATRPNHEAELKNLKEWKKFAEDMRTRFQPIAEDMYVETVAYEFVGWSATINHYEYGGEYYLFKNKDTTLVVEKSSWRGKQPVEGEKVFIARDRSDHQFPMFFAATKTEKGFFTEPTVIKEIARIHEERKRFASGK
jgi:hypothetical protein